MNGRDISSVTDFRIVEKFLHSLKVWRGKQKYVLPSFLGKMMDKKDESETNRWTDSNIDKIESNIEERALIFQI